MALKPLAILCVAGLAAAACVPVTDPDEPQMLKNISPEALAALPAGVDPGFLIRNREGCYGIALEQGDPPRGIALLDANGLPVCDT